MKRVLSVLMCVLLSVTALVGCENQEAQKKPVKEDFTPTKLNISALYDGTACALSYLMEQNTVSKLKGNYAVSLYKDTDALNNEFMFGLGFTTISGGIELCKSKDYARMLSLISLNIDAFSKSDLGSIEDFGNKKVLIFDDSELSHNLNVMLKKAAVNCDIEKCADLYDFTQKIKESRYDIVVAAYPAASEVLEYGKAYKYKLSINDEWERLKLNGKPFTHCIVASSEIISDEFPTCELFFDELNTSIEKLNNQDNTVVQSISGRYLNTNNTTALTTCLQNGFTVEDYKDTEKLLKNYAKVRNEGGEKLSYDHVIFSF